jgi:hypothetical protein
MPKATVIGKADEGNLQVRLDEGSGSRRNKDPKRSARVSAFKDSESVQVLLHFYSTKLGS